MFENHYDQNTNTNESEYVPAPQENRPSGKKPNGMFRKIAAVLCVALIGCGSVAGYRYYENNKNDSRSAIETKEELSDTKTEEVLTETEKDYRAENLSYLSKGEDSLTTQEIYKKCLPSSVGITSNFEVKQQTGGFFGYSGNTASKQMVGTGTGIVLSEDGYIITNAHVIYAGNYKVKASAVKILLSDQTELDAEIVGYDVQADVALLKADTKGAALTAAEFGNSDDLEVGDFAVAIGNPLGFDLFGTMTVGYISGLKREISVDTETIPLIQTDAAINSGNSGGPLINDRGQVIGINSSKLSSSYSGNEASIEGLGFAIPINEALEIVNYFKDGQQTSKKIMLGLTCREISSSSSQYYAEDAGADVFGLLVTDLVADGPAEKAGVMTDDVIVGADGEAVQTFKEFNAVKNKKKAGDKLRLTIIRERKYVTVDVILEEMEVTEETENNEQDPQIPDETPQQGIQPDEQDIPQEGMIPDGGQGYGGYDPFGFGSFEDFFGRLFP